MPDVYALAPYRPLLRARLSPQRCRHSEGVCTAAAALAEHYGADVKKAALAGLLHDYCKELPPAEQLQILRGSAIILDVETLASPQIWHGPAASVCLPRELGVHDEQVLAAVRYHTTGRENMSPLEEIVYLADLISAERDYPDVARMRALAFEGLAPAMLYALQFSIRSLTDKARPICRDTINAYNAYARAARAV